MSYVAHITVPVSFDASSDRQARQILSTLRWALASINVRDIDVSSFDDDVLPIPAGAAPEVIDYPDADMREILPRAEHREVPVSDVDIPASCDDCGADVYVSGPYADVVESDGSIHVCPNQ